MTSYLGYILTSYFFDSKNSCFGGSGFGLPNSELEPILKIFFFSSSFFSSDAKGLAFENNPCFTSKTAGFGYGYSTVIILEKILGFAVSVWLLNKLGITGFTLPIWNATLVVGVKFTNGFD